MGEGRTSYECARADCLGRLPITLADASARWAPVVTRMDLPGAASDQQCRYLEAAVSVIVASIYAPIGNPSLAPNLITSSLG